MHKVLLLIRPFKSRMLVYMLIIKKKAQTANHFSSELIPNPRVITPKMTVSVRVTRSVGFGSGIVSCVVYMCGAEYEGGVYVLLVVLTLFK